MSINTKLIKKNAYRVTKKRGKTALRIRVPGGHLDVRFLDTIKEIADKYGNGTIHITIRQGFEIPEIDFGRMHEINELIAPLIKGLELDIGVDIRKPEEGYPSAGTRNISACIGNRVCPFANYDTTAFAYKIEKAVFPNDYHVKIALTGCPNDCIKAHLQDFGIIGQVDRRYDEYRCVGCQACVDNCRRRVTGALSMVNYKVKLNKDLCIGCGECIMKCPTGAWYRNPEKYYRLIVMGRTGKKNPRLAQTFLEWVDEETILKILKNTYEYIDKFIDKNDPSGKEHVGYIFDRTGYQVFREYVLKDVNLGPMAKVADHIGFSGYSYSRNSLMK
ncbi:MAG: sulfite reductase subunit C [Bacillota bacterium]